MLLPPGKEPELSTAVSCSRADRKTGAGVSSQGSSESRSFLSLHPVLKVNLPGKQTKWNRDTGTCLTSCQHATLSAIKLSGWF